MTPPFPTRRASDRFSLFSSGGSGRAKIDRRIGGLRGRGVVIGPGIAGHTEHALGQLVAVDLARPATDRRGACRKPGTRPARFFESCGSLSVDHQLEQFLLILLPDQLRDGPPRSEEHTSDIQSLMHISYAVS